jgi:NADH-quinone oxidoreductase subunit I
MYGRGLLKGLRITARHTFSRPETELYPYERKKLPEASRIFLAMKCDEEGNPACRACNACIVGCPDGVLKLVKDPDDPKRPVEFVVDSGRCTFCGLCVEGCPFSALYFTQDFERATSDRDDLVYHLVQDGRATHEGEDER